MMGFRFTKEIEAGEYNEMMMMVMGVLKYLQSLHTFQRDKI